MKKSIYRILSLVVIMAVALTMTAFAEGEIFITLSAGEVTVSQGKGTVDVEIPIALEGEIMVTTLQVETSFDKNIKFVEYIKGDSLEGIVEPAVETNPVILPFVDFTLKGVVAKTGNFATLRLRVPVDKAAEYPVVVKVTEANNDKFEKITDVFRSINGKIVVEGTREIPVADSDIDVSEKENSDDKEGSKGLTSEKRAEDVICLKIDNPTAFAYGKYGLIDSSNDKVVPYIKNDRTLVPLRFVSETLGAEVEWESGWNYCYVNKGDKKIKITFGSADIEVNGEVITYDAPVEVVQDRTMVPIRFISEELGYHVYWNQPNKVVIITPADNPWVEKRSAENDLLLDMLVTFLLNGMI